MASTEVLTEVSLKTRIHRHLIDLAKAGEFFRILYDQYTGHSQTEYSDDFKQHPKSISANQTQTSFITPRMYRGTLIKEIDFFTWQLILAFQHEVDDSKFKLSLLSPTNCIIKADKTTNTPQITLELDNVLETHPPQHESVNGSLLQYNITARIGRP